MIPFEGDGDNDFASIFESVGLEQARQRERAQADLLLRLLDEIQEEDDDEPPGPPRVEHLKIAADGEIKRGPPHERVAKVMQVDDLPKESEYELLFGKQEDPEPPFRIETGMRLSDKKAFSTLILNEESNNVPLFTWTGIKFEYLVLAAALAFFFMMVAMKSSRESNARRLEAARAEARAEARVQAEVERRVRLALAERCFY